MLTESRPMWTETSAAIPEKKAAKIKTKAPVGYHMYNHIGNDLVERTIQED